MANRQKTSKRRGLSSFVTFLIAVAVILGVYFASGLRLCAVVSGSMEPTIPTWSLCVVSTRVAYDEIEEGDVIVYVRSDGKRIIHRVVDETREGLITRGDANRSDDAEPVTEEAYFGRCLTHVPYLGKLPMLIRTPAGIIAMVAAAVLLLLLSLHDGKKDRGAGAGGA